MRSSSHALTIAKSLMKIDTTHSSGIDEAILWITNWATRHSLPYHTLKNTKALLIQTNPNAVTHFSFVTHLDVVPADGWDEAFVPRVENSQLIGRGAVDDKGPLAIALSVLLENKNRTDVNISCLIVTDEETTNLEISEILRSGAYSPDFAFVVDGGTYDQLDIGQKGIIRCDLTLTTKGGHSAFEDSIQSASIQLLAVLSEFQKFAEALPCQPPFNPTFINVSSIVSQTVPYGLPDLARAALEIQFPPPVTSGQWIKKFNEATDTYPNLKIETHWITEPHILGDQRILSIFDKMGVESITTGGNNLAKDLCLAGISAASHCPVTEYLAHCKDEKIGIEDIERGITLYNSIINLFASK